MGRAHRWGLAAVATALVMVTPFVGRLRPAHDPDVPTVDLVAAVRDSAAAPYSGTSRCTAASGCRSPTISPTRRPASGAHTRMRVWWREADDWRVDKLLATGEVDLFHHGRATTGGATSEAEAQSGDRPRDPAAARLRPAASRAGAAGVRPTWTPPTSPGCPARAYRRARRARPAARPGHGAARASTTSTSGPTPTPASCCASTLYGDASQPALSTAFTSVDLSRPPTSSDHSVPSRARAAPDRGRRARHRRRRQPVSRPCLPPRRRRGPGRSPPPPGGRRHLRLRADAGPGAPPARRDAERSPPAAPTSGAREVRRPARARASARSGVLV